ncbi:hypothetical protein QVD17_04411 [Tagetes erecta]|uniref:Uncharacterized protein n=1 Tax=Tagetes erecta TaxID=13708 RepID=A0AAD8PAQ0_TARER|nr:hypothetical protein QVD17_04411 [Tagetes erecta]
MDSKGLILPVPESEKMEASVLGCRLSEKAEHLPIKKRRFLFRSSSPSPPPPPLNRSSSEGTECVAASAQSPSQDAHLKPDASCPSAESLTVADLPQSKSNDSKLHVQKFGTYSKKATEKNDKSDTSVAPGTLDFKAISVKLEKMTAKETDFHIPTSPSKYVASSTVSKSIPDESTLNNTSSLAPSEPVCTKSNQVTSNIQKSAASDDRLSWDLNTVMAWEEQLECDHNVTNCKEGKSEYCEQRMERGSVSENVGNKISPAVLKSLIPKNEGSELEECKPGCNDIRKLSPVTNSVPLVAVSKILSLHNQHADSSFPDAVPNARTLDYPTCEISAKHTNTMAAGTDFTFMPLGFGHGINIREGIVSSKLVASQSNGNHIITGMQTNENDKLKLSLVTGHSLENKVHQTESTLDVDDKANVKRVFTSNKIAMENSVSKGTESSHNVHVSAKSVSSGNCVNHYMTSVQTENEKLNLSLVTTTSTELVVPPSGKIFDNEDDKGKVKKVVSSERIIMENPSTMVSTYDTVGSNAETPLDNGKSHLNLHDSETTNNNQEVCDNGNLPCDIQARSEVDNIDELSFGYDDSLFEDGEFRESSIQTWEGNDGADREIEHGTENRDTFTHENDSLKSTDVGSQKGMDEISSVLMPEKCKTEVNTNDACQSDQGKMNVSGSDLLPENRSSSSNITRIKDLSGIKSSSKITEDLETKIEPSRFYRREPSTRDAFSTRSRFRMQGSSSNADESCFGFVRDSGVIRSVGRGKYTRGGGMWDRSPPFRGSSFRRSLREDVDHFTDKVGDEPNVRRGSFRSRLMVNSEEDEFRARLGLRPSGDTRNNRFVNVGRGRSLKYGSRHNMGPRERHYGDPANDEPSMDYSHSFPARRMCFSPTHQHSGSTSPPRTRTRSPIGDSFRGRSRSPILTRMRRGPNYRHGIEPEHAGGYNLEQSRNNNSPCSSRILKYRQRSFPIERRSPPSGERLVFSESSRKTKQNENYRSSRFSELHGGGRDDDVMDHGYRRDGFVRPYDMGMGRSIKRIQYNEEDGFGPPVYDSRDKEALEFHGRGNSKPYVGGIDSRFRDLPRRPREDRDKW